MFHCNADKFALLSLLQHTTEFDENSNKIKMHNYKQRSLIKTKPEVTLFSKYCMNEFRSLKISEESEVFCCKGKQPSPICGYVFF